VASIICYVMSSSTPITALLLAGPSSVGKTTLAAALQRMLPEPWVFLPADLLTDGFPAGGGLGCCGEGSAQQRSAPSGSPG
jgi:chloramphenicol 3-O-phosphotransferase